MSGLVFEHYPEGGGEMLTALCLADHADHDGTSIYPAVDTVAKLTRQSRRTVQYHLSKMQESGWLLLVGNAKGGRQKAREYRINPSWIETGKLPEKGAKTAPFNSDGLVGAEAVDNSVKGAPAIAPFGEVKGATGDTKGCNLEQERVQSGALKGAPAIAPEPSVPVIDPSVTRGAGAPPDHIRNSTTGEINPRSVQIAIVLRKTYGMTDATSNSAAVIEMDRMGVTDLEIAEHVDIFRIRKPDEKPNASYLHRMIASTRKRAAAPQQAEGPAGFAPPPEQWWTSASGIERVGQENGVKWQKARGEAFADFKVRVLKAAGEGPWRDAYFADLLRKPSTRYAGDHEYVYGHPPIEIQA
ncbi:MAG: helix-turn-helix domain-containing protein [Pseudomonas sp.]